MTSIRDSAEFQRLEENRKREKYWKKWGSYLSERQWGTIREDYSADGDAWNYFTHHQSRYRTYRWGEDGIAGLSDTHQYLNFSVALWNGKDGILKERLFGLNGHEGNHGEDVKELYYYLDNTPTHSYMKYLYRYPQSKFPYDVLVEKNSCRSKEEPEFEVFDTGVFDNKEYFDVFVEYAKSDPTDICIKISIINNSQQDAELTILGQAWFRNIWRWNENTKTPVAHIEDPGRSIRFEHKNLDTYFLYAKKPDEIIFTDNETNTKVLYNDPNRSKYTKEGFHRYIVNNLNEAINPEQKGTKSAMMFKLNFKREETKEVFLRLSTKKLVTPFQKIEDIFTKRREEADEFYSYLTSEYKDEQLIQRQAFAGMLWGKQYYHYIVREWLKGDPTEINPPTERLQGRNSDWKHFHAEDILSVPDTWEYPWFASWDTAFQLIPLVMIDPEFAKKQLLLFTREWYTHPNGNIPAYEWNFSDTNPPVQAYAAWKVFKLESEIYQNRDETFLERVFHKLLLNFTWWVNKIDKEGNNIFTGGFLGLDNIGIFDRSHPLPEAQKLDQADGTAWMAMYSLNMMRIALELAQSNPAYEDTASKFFEHFIRIAHSIKTIGDDKTGGLWDEDDQFFYDMLHWKSGDTMPLKIRSIVGLIPLFAVEVVEADILDKVPEFNRRMHWFIENRPDLAEHVICENHERDLHRHLFSIVQEEQLEPILMRVFDEEEFLSEYGIRSLSKYHKDYPYYFELNDESIIYEPAESVSGFFGGNSNWRGPIWFPINYLIVESLHEFHTYFEDRLKFKFPRDSENELDLGEIANKLRERLVKIFRKEKNKRAVYTRDEYHNKSSWIDLVLFYEYFHGDNGSGLGASHQTGWTGIIAEMVYRLNRPFKSDPDS